MELEKIIASVENFVEATAEKEDRNLYHAYLENPQVRKDFKGSHLSIVDLAETVLALRRELAEKEDKRTHGASFVQRTRLAEKVIAECSREEMRGSWTQNVFGEACQCFMNGYMAFALREPLTLPAVPYGDGTDLEKFFKDWGSYPVTGYDIGKIGMELKTHKKEANKGHCLVEFNGKFFNAQFFQDAVKILGGSPEFLNNPAPLSASFFRSDFGCAILMPVRCEAVKNHYTFSGLIEE